jgi:hypothetical protein
MTEHVAGGCDEEGERTKSSVETRDWLSGATKELQEWNDAMTRINWFMSVLKPLGNDSLFEYYASNKKSYAEEIRATNKNEPFHSCDEVYSLISMLDLSSGDYHHDEHDPLSVFHDAVCKYPKFMEEENYNMIMLEVSRCIKCQNDSNLARSLKRLVLSANKGAEAGYQESKMFVTELGKAFRTACGLDGVVLNVKTCSIRGGGGGGGGGVSSTASSLKKPRIFH